MQKREKKKVWLRVDDELVFFLCRGAAALRQDRVTLERDADASCCLG